jgi:hypothetical protein
MRCKNRSKPAPDFGRKAQPWIPSLAAHRAGEALEADYVGMTLSVIDED